MKTYNLKDIKIILRDNGYRLERCSGDHLIYIKDGHHISIPANKKQPNRMVWQRLVKENNLTLTR